MKLSILICTMKRPEYLRDLLRALEVAAGSSHGLETETVIVDNDPAMSARIIAQDETGNSLPIRYVSEPVANISIARNRALAAARHSLCLFLDDDQLVGPQFFTELEQTITQAPSDFSAIRLAIHWQFEKDIAAWKKRALAGDPAPHAARHLQNLLRTEMGTGGLVLNRAQAAGAGQLWFDPTLGTSGGEDVDFYLRSQARGEKFLFANMPEVRERVPAARATLAYGLRSSRRKGYVDGKLALRDESRQSRAIYICRSILLTILAALLLPLTLCAGRGHLAAAAFLLARQWGKIIALTGRALPHYSSAPCGAVLHLTGGGQDGGAEKIIEQISLHTPDSAHGLCFFFYDSSGPRPFSQVVSRRWPHVVHHQKSAGIDLLLWWRLFLFVRKHNVAVIHTHDIGAMLHAVVVRMITPGLRLIHTEHTLHYWIVSKKYRLLYKVMSGFFKSIACVSGYVRHELREKVGVSPDKLKVVPNGVDTEGLIAAARQKETMQRSPPQLALVSVSRIDELKNITRILSGIALARQRGLDVVLTHVGTGKSEDVAVISAQIEELGLSGAVTMVGYQTNVAPFLNAADCFVSASRVECHPVSVLEAMAIGKPCILSSIAPHRELLQDGIILFDDHDDSVVDALIKINEQINSFPQFAYNLISATEKSYSIPVMLTRYNALYAGI
jgi:glycosyltransferase involved in cell wall biosynthesis